MLDKVQKELSIAQKSCGYKSLGSDLKEAMEHLILMGRTQASDWEEKEPSRL